MGLAGIGYTDKAEIAIYITSASISMSKDFPKARRNYATKTLTLERAAMIYDVNSPLFRSFLSQKGGPSDKRWNPLLFLSDHLIRVASVFYSFFFMHDFLIEGRSADSYCDYVSIINSE